MKIIDPASIPAEQMKKLPLFFQPGYFGYVSDSRTKCLIIADDNGVMVPLRIYRRFIFNTGQFLFCPMRFDGRPVETEEKVFLEKLIVFVRKKRMCDVLLAPIHVCLFHGSPKGAIVSKLGIISLGLEESSDTIFSGFSKTYRTQIKQCEKAGFQINMTEKHLEIFFDNYKKHHVRQKKAYESIAGMQKLLSGIPENAKLFSVINAAGVWEGGVLLLYDRHRGYYLIGAKNEDSELHNGSQKFLHWNIILFLKNKQVPFYNFGGHRYDLENQDKFSSIQDFKMKFGSRIEEGIHFYIILSPKYHLYKTLIRLKEKAG